MRHGAFHHMGGHAGGAHIGDFLRLAGIIFLMVFLLAVSLEFLAAIRTKPEERRAQTAGQWILFYLGPIAIAAGLLAWLAWSLGGHSR